MEVKRITLPMSKETAKSLRAGDRALLSGTLYTARDAAHGRLMNLIEKGEKLPFDITGQVIYYAGPSPAKPGEVIGSIGPTTSGRMDAFTPTLLDKGLAGCVGKGKRSKEVRESLKKNGAVYFAATGGAAALLAQRVKSCEVVAYEDLGCEAIRCLEVEDLPVTVINDSEGNDLYEEVSK